MRSIPRLPRIFRRKIAASFLVVLAAILSMMPSAALAGTATGSLAISATVLSVCIVATTPVAFGNYNGSSSTAATSNGSVVVTCTNGTPYTVAMGAGGGTSATVAARSMLNGSNALNYGLYTNTNHTTIWGDGTNSTSTVSGTAGVLPTTYTVYGQIPTGQYVATGAYTDTVTVTVSY